METRIARSISYIFHPLLIPTYVTLILLNLPVFFSFMLTITGKAIMTGLIFTMTFVFPFIIVILMKRKNLIHSVFLESREERVYPYLAIAMLYYATYFMMHQVHASQVFTFFMLGATFLATCCLVINFFFMISMHMTAVGAMLGFFLGLSLNLKTDFLWLIVSLLLITGLTGFARLKDSAHRPAEIYSGFIMGFTVMFLFFLLI